VRIQPSVKLCFPFRAFWEEEFLRSGIYQDD